jgi:hypothetical protein
LMAPQWQLARIVIVPSQLVPIAQFIHDSS